MKKSILPPTESNEILKAWDEKADTIRAFIEKRPQYEQLCNEVAYILGKRMNEGNIEFSAITSRAKSLNSFIEKLSRKSYQNPISEITDFAGVRLVYLYKDDQTSIEKIIESEFRIIEKIDKIAEREPNEFGYGALHYLVNIGKKSSGARYDDLKELVCEIQVRTVLQDAWAVIYHHLSYKHESDVPQILLRKLNSVSGLFETADDQFNNIRLEREKYKKSIRPQLNNEKKFLDQEINLDTFAEFLKWKFPLAENIASHEGHLAEILQDVRALGYKRLSELNSLIIRTEDALDAYAKKMIPSPSGAGSVARALAFVHPSYREQSWGPQNVELFRELEELVH